MTNFITSAGPLQVPPSSVLSGPSPNDVFLDQVFDNGDAFVCVDKRTTSSHYLTQPIK